MPPSIQDNPARSTPRLADGTVYVGSSEMKDRPLASTVRRWLPGNVLKSWQHR